MRRKHLLLHDLAKTSIVFFFTCLLVFSMMPQKSLHTIFAKHTDVETCSVHKNLPIDQIESSQIHCKVDHLVVALPFIKTNILFISVHDQFFLKTLVFNTQNYFPSFLQIIDSRGPPNNV